MIVPFRLTASSEEVAAEVEAVDGPVDAAAEKKPDGKL